MTAKFVWSVLCLSVAVVLFWLMSLSELHSFLDSDRKKSKAIYSQGMQLNFGPESLVGSRPRHDSTYSQTDTGLILERVTKATQLSLKLPLSYIDLGHFDRITLELESDNSGEIRFFYRNSRNGPIIRSNGLPVIPGRMQLTSTVHDLDWSIQSDTSADAITWLPYPEIGHGAEPMSELIIGLFFTEPSRVVLGKLKLTPSQQAAIDAVTIRVIDSGLDRPQPVLKALSETRQSEPASVYVHQSHAFSLIRINPWLPGIIIGLLFAASLIIDLRLERPASALLCLSATVLTVGLTGRASLEEATNWGILILPLLVICVPPLIYRKWGRLLPRSRPRLPLLLTAIVVTSTATLLIFAPGQDSAGAALFHRYLMYLPWALFQQLILCAGLFRLCSRIYRHRTPDAGILPVLMASLLFGWLHYPNLELMIATSLLAVVCTTLFRHGQDILTLALLHALLGTAALTWLTPDWFYSGEIGYAFYRN